jgi:hypothetical protein
MRYRSHMIVAFTLTVFALTAVAFSSVTRQTQQQPTDPAANTAQSGTGGQKKAPKELEPVALRLIAEQHNLQVADLEITNSHISTYPNSGRKANVFSITDKRSDEDYDIAIDDNGHVLDRAKLADEDRAVRLARYGKLSPDLAELLKTAPPDQEISVTISLNLPPDDDRPKDPSTMNSEKLKRMTEREKKRLDEQGEEYDRQLEAYNNARAKRVVQPVVERLKALGYDPEVIGNTGHIGLKLKPAMIKQVERWKEVREIFLNRKAQPNLDVSRRTIGADLVQNRGIDGTGVPVAQIEVGGRVLNTIGQNNPYLPPFTQDNNFVCPNFADEHAVAVAGIIHSQATLPPVFRGVSPGASLWCPAHATAIYYSLSRALMVL